TPDLRRQWRLPLVACSRAGWSFALGCSLLPSRTRSSGAGWLFAPHSFYQSFPGFGVHWVEPLGAYSEHAFSDFGGALLAIALLTWFAGLWLERRLVQAALTTVLFEAASHFIYHLSRLSAMSMVNDFANQLSLAYAVVLSFAL